MHVENHPLGLVARFAEALGDFQALGELQLLLLRSFGLHALANLDGERLRRRSCLQHFLDAFGAHHGDEFTRELLVELALFRSSRDHFSRSLDASGASPGSIDDESFEVENTRSSSRSVISRR